MAASRADSRSLLEGLDVGVMAFDGDGRAVYANPVALEFLGLEWSELCGRSSSDLAWDIIDPDGRAVRPEDAASHRARVSGRPVRDVVIGLARPHRGDRIWLNTCATPRIGPSGEVEEVVVSLSDISSRRAVEDILRQANDRLERRVEARTRELEATVASLREEIERRQDAQLELQRALERTELLLSAAPGLLLYRARIEGPGRAEIVHLSEGAGSVLGFGPDDVPVPLTALRERVHPEDFAAFLPSWARGTSDELGPIDAEVRMRPHDGARWRWTSVRARPDSTDGAMFWSGSVVDIDDRRRMTEVLHETQKLEAVGVLAAGVAHNFINLLAVIIPNVDQALSMVDSSLRPLLEDALVASRHARDLIRQLTVVGNAQGPREERELDLAALVRGASDIVRRSFESGIEVRTEIAVSEAPVRGSEAHLHQVLMNLSMNARDALERSSRPLIRYRLRAVEDSFLIEIEDNGEGMSAAQLARLGEPFFTTKPPGRGTGLGVATAFGIVSDHGGQVRFRSRPGEGTRVTITLPRARATGPRREPHPEGAAPTAQTGARVLVVDDEPLVRRAVARQLERSGYAVTEAADGWACLAHVREHELDVVLLDISMPGLSGTEALKRVGAIKPRLPVILMSGRLSEEVETLGAAALLQKPVNRARLVETLESVLVPAP